MTDNSQVRGQYKAAAQALKEYLTDWENGRTSESDAAFSGPVMIALSNLAVVEAIHRVAAALEEPHPIVVVTDRGVDPGAVADQLREALSWRREPPR